jgi:hypothetical protein
MSKVLVYQPLGIENGQLAHPVNSGDYETVHALVNGTARASTWRPLAFQLISSDEGVQLTPVDFPWFGSNALVFRQRALEALMPLLRQHGEFLPLASKPKLWIFNPTRVIDAFDQSASNVSRFSDGRIMLIHAHAFKPHMLTDSLVFKIPDLRVSPTFFTHLLVQQVQSLGLTGLQFNLIWEGVGAQAS